MAKVEYWKYLVSKYFQMPPKIKNTKINVLQRNFIIRVTCNAYIASAILIEREDL